MWIVLIPLSFSLSLTFARQQIFAEMALKLLETWKKDFYSLNPVHSRLSKKFSQCSCFSLSMVKYYFCLQGLQSGTSHKH